LKSSKKLFSTIIVHKLTALIFRIIKMSKNITAYWISFNIIQIVTKMNTKDNSVIVDCIYTYKIFFQPIKSYSHFCWCLTVQTVKHDYMVSKLIRSFYNLFIPYQILFLLLLMSSLSNTCLHCNKEVQKKILF
jgi:hypothetical protein